MKKLLLLIFPVFLFVVACEKVVDVDLNTEPSRLVIDAAIERIYLKDNLTEFQDKITLNLSLTQPFFSNESSIAVETASVRIIALSTNTTIPLVHDTEGSYILNSDTAFSIDPDENYRLEVNYGGELFIATESLAISTPILDLKQVPSPVDFDETGPAVSLTFNDLPGKINYLVFDFGDGDIFSQNDEFIEEGNDFTFLSILEENVIENVTARIIGADNDFATFIDDITTISDDGGGPFGVTPFRVHGNIVNETNEENYPFGYFRVNEVYSKKIPLVADETLQ